MHIYPVDLLMHIYTFDISYVLNCPVNIKIKNVFLLENFSQDILRFHIAFCHECLHFAIDPQTLSSKVCNNQV